MGLSKLAAGCRSCPYVNTCGHKRMEAVGFLPESCVSNSASKTAAGSAAQPLLRETREIWINGKPVTVYVDEIEKELTKELGLYAHLGLQFGA